ncbi:helix-turn-helix domain-containing protein [Antribacter sp. KLBMP9083]|uniref:Helix-turn-helix domain-containing protein n=1 Tax=Antribacter soli TaxID=2910976 RepID=A0AA41QH24_9MICO|nr:helix-turn-helix domain-containing protein [Antribacter soli]MCF4123348.1 helix-turn-helix domain-containing protein [Antribacter soli]
MTDLPELATTQEAADYLRVSVGHLQNLRCAGAGPAFVKIGGGVRYLREDLLAWVAARRIIPAEHSHLVSAASRP